MKILLDSIAVPVSLQVAKSLTGTLDHSGIREFWIHVQQLEEWKSHPLFASSSSEELGRVLSAMHKGSKASCVLLLWYNNCMHLCPWGSGTIPFIFHVDGAEFYTNSEYLVWSFSSALSSGDVR